QRRGLPDRNRCGATSEGRGCDGGQRRATDRCRTRYGIPVAHGFNVGIDDRRGTSRTRPLTYDEVEVRDRDVVKVRLTPSAYAHGLALALLEKCGCLGLASPAGFEPATFRLEGGCSVH